MGVSLSKWAVINTGLTFDIWLNFRRPLQRWSLVRLVTRFTLFGYKHRKSFTAAGNVCSEELLVEAVSEATRSNFRTCKFLWGTMPPLRWKEGLTSFPGPPTVQFLIACNVQKWRGKAWFILSLEWYFVYLGSRGEEESLIKKQTRKNKRAWDFIL